MRGKWNGMVKVKAKGGAKVNEGKDGKGKERNGMEWNGKEWKGMGRE